jgi:hypothetical protein
MRIDWDKYNFDRRLTELQYEHDNLSSGALHRAIAEQLNTEFSATYGVHFTEDSVRNRLKRITFDQLGDAPVTVIMPYYEEYKDIIEGYTLPPTKMVNGMEFSEYIETMRVGHRKTLVMSDLHIPFQNDDYIQHAVESNLTADLVVLNGDLMDAYALSTFVKSIDVPIYSEIDGIVRVFKWLSELFPNAFIVITEGNHEGRVARRLLPMMPAGLAFLANDDIMSLLARPFPNIVATGDWFFQVADAIYAHADSASGVAAKPALDVLNWFIAHQEQEGLEPFTLTLQAHTHRVAVVYQGKYKAMETGCLCAPMSYARTTKHRFPQQQGYVVVQQEQGKTDFTRSREFVFSR